MSDRYTYEVVCRMGNNREECPYIMQGMVKHCVSCDGVGFLRRNREDYAWQKEKVEQKDENKEQNKEN